MATPNPRRTIFFPPCWGLDGCDDPLETIERLLEIIHDMEGDGVAGCDDMREDTSAFADELEAPVCVKRLIDDSVLFEIDLDGVPIGCQREVPEQPSLYEIVEMLHDVAASATNDLRWMSDWYATQLAIVPIGDCDKLLLRTKRIPKDG